MVFLLGDPAELLGSQALAHHSVSFRSQLASLEYPDPGILSFLFLQLAFWSFTVLHYEGQTAALSIWLTLRSSDGSFPGKGN